MNRQEILDGLRQSPKVDVCVIGGGINGISVFRELALQGLNVLLVEKHDYCSGASSALSRMVHGGLRYLENGEFKLVQESLVERDRLLRNAPHYVAPLPTTVPVFDIFSGLGNGIVRFLGLSRRPSRRGAVAIKAGLCIYDFLTRKRALMPRHQFRGRRGTLAKWPALNPDIKSSATYFDAWVSHPERLGIELLQDGLSAKFGAMALNYAELQRTEDGQYRVEDQIGGASVAVEPTLIINATGGWIDIANQTLFSPEARPAPLMGGTKGSHLIVDNADLRDALAGHMIYYENEDGRICILFPYLGKVLVGSTDIRVDDPETVRCEADERDYILQSLAFVLPDIAIRPEQIVFQFSGVRPLPASTDSFTGRIPRDHFCTVIEPKDGGPPVLCMIGGKWTTFRSFGELAADMALERLGRQRRVATTDRPIGGGQAFPANVPVWLAQAASKGLPGGRMAELFARYGTDAEAVAGFIVAGPDTVLPHAGYSVRELQFLIREEAVEHLDDLLLRRTTLAVSGELSLDMMDAALDLLTQEKHWTLAHRTRERHRFLTLLTERHGVDEDMLSARNEPRSTECDTTAKSG
ncbi:glycerol-3-phosphate dehydrogenase/oxidase [Rhizobium laguerreae]|uniref:Glycerol-3-phosphate dehydrogenase n=1 Tax=Rhizobium laguerreae TaxID=1076926 RepID=A0AAX2QKQ1_9HYPH|nr:glycerol-3-phosphate dehydrogenase/oxidase [Rhizobium laguerreae]MBY3527133.1 glycerol-3-phosphate dehydrogenase/oxidase [Rhizobium laguerreae]NKM32769.1 FAD-dependent oxidoreductase [Rhizobium laguerreae]TCU23390.1 glycerol-3-phosphate dehydrogenase [Rhizobium laguerreae]